MRRPWRSYTELHYPAFDLLEPGHVGDFDVVLCEQVLEHVPDPWRATGATASICRPGGHIILSTPFMMRVHLAPGDYWRYTPDALRLMVEQRYLEVLEIGTWGNSWSIFANRHRAPTFRAWHRWLSRWALANDPLNPQMIWLFARKPMP